MNRDGRNAQFFDAQRLVSARSVPAHRAAIPARAKSAVEMKMSGDASLGKSGVRPVCAVRRLLLLPGSVMMSDIVLTAILTTLDNKTFVDRRH